HRRRGAARKALHRPLERPRSADSHLGRAADLELPAVAAGLHRVVHDAGALARRHATRSLPGDPRLPAARTAVRQSHGPSLMSRNLLVRIAVAVPAIAVTVAVLWLGGWVLATALARLGRAGAAPAGRDVGVRHVRHGCGDPDRRAEAHAGPVAAQDVGGSRRWRGGRPHRRVAVRAAGAQSPRLATQRLATRDGGCGGGGCGPGGRRRRVAVQARSGGQGLVVPHPWPWGRARPARFPLLRLARDGGIAAPVRGRMSVGVAILGSTGSIGCSTLHVLARQRERFRVVALTAHSNAELLARQAAEWQPAYVGLVNGGERGSGPGARGSGANCLVEAATHPDVRIVVNGVVGAAGLEATLAALRAGKRVALANKETLVMAGELVTRAAREGGGEIVP